MARRSAQKKDPHDGPQPCIVCLTPTGAGIIDFDRRNREEDALIRHCPDCLAEYEKSHKPDHMAFHEYTEALKLLRDINAGAVTGPGKITLGDLSSHWEHKGDRWMTKHLAILEAEGLIMPIELYHNETLIQRKPKEAAV